MNDYDNNIGLELSILLDSTCDFSTTFYEGGNLGSFIRLQFINNQNPFTITFRPVSIHTTEELGLGFFINSDAIPLISRATSGNTNWSYVVILMTTCIMNKFNYSFQTCRYCFFNIWPCS